MKCLIAAVSIGFTANTYTVVEGELASVNVAITSLDGDILAIPIQVSLASMDTGSACKRLSTLSLIYTTSVSRTMDCTEFDVFDKVYSFAAPVKRNCFEMDYVMSMATPIFSNGSVINTERNILIPIINDNDVEIVKRFLVIMSLENDLDGGIILDNSYRLGEVMAANVTVEIMPDPLDSKTLLFLSPSPPSLPPSLLPFLHPSLLLSQILRTFHHPFPQVVVHRLKELL